MLEEVTRKRWRLATVVLCMTFCILILTGWLAFEQSMPLSTLWAWRAAAAVGLGILFLNAPTWLSMWRGDWTPSDAPSRGLPFELDELESDSPLHPSAGRGGVTGRNAVSGLGLLGLALATWVGGLALLGPGVGGETTLSPGQIRAGFTPYGVSYSQSIGYQLTMTRFDGDEGAVHLRVADPGTGSEALFALGSSESVRLAGYRLTLVDVQLDAAIGPTVRLRFAREWVWWWRVVTAAFAMSGLGLLLLAPHRSWVWDGEPGAYALRVWSLNRPGRTAGWMKAAIDSLLTPARQDELRALEGALAERAGATQSTPLRRWSPPGGLIAAASFLSLGALFTLWREVETDSPFAAHQAVILAAVAVSLAVPQGRSKAGRTVVAASAFLVGMAM